MSKYSGKCDFADSVEIWGTDFVLNSDIFYKDLPVPLKIDSEKDLVPFYPFIVSTASVGKNSGMVVLSERSFVDVEEAEILGWYKSEMVKAKRRCARKKLKFVPEDEASKFLFVSDEVRHNILPELARRVDKDRENASLEGLRLPLSEHYRGELFKEMIRVGYSRQQAIWWIWKDRVWEET